MRIKTLSIREHGQDIVFQTFSPVSGLALMNTKPIRYADNQAITASSPCLATNLGLYKICIHCNVDMTHPKAVVYEFAQPVKPSTARESEGSHSSAKGNQEADDGDDKDKQDGQEQLGWSDWFGDDVGGGRSMLEWCDGRAEPDAPYY